jgi:hypothetical protein
VECYMWKSVGIVLGLATVVRPMSLVGSGYRGDTYELVALGYI